MIVADKTGKKLGYNQTLENAQEPARMNDVNGASAEIITDEQYEQLFGRDAYSG